MPGGVPRTSARALARATLTFVLAIADKGWRKALQDDAHLCQGLNVYAGHVTHEAVAASQVGHEHRYADDPILGQRRRMNVERLKSLHCAEGLRPEQSMRAWPMEDRPDW